MFSLLCDQQISLDNGMDHRNRHRRAKVKRVSETSIVLYHENIDPRRQSVLVFSFGIDGESYSFGAVPVLGVWTEREMEIEWPRSIHVAERRTRIRRKPRIAERVSIEHPSESVRTIVGRVSDKSKEGLGLVANTFDEIQIGSQLVLRYENGEFAGRSEVGEVRNCSSADPPGWKRLGLQLNPVAVGRDVAIESRSAIVPGGMGSRGWSKISFGREAVRLASEKAISRLGRRSPRFDSIRAVKFPNAKGHEISGIVDRSELRPGGHAVVIPPAWGRTKETLLPLARTLVETFASAQRPVTVLRYDGTQRRGESFVDAACRSAGDEALKFTYTQAAEDLLAAARFLKTDAEFSVDRLVLVSFSLASIESRIALASDSESLIDGWISVVGMTDVQSSLKAVSGGVDYVFGKEAGIEFGIHELGGVRIDIDHAANDVLKSGIASLNEARHDMDKIDLPITWIHGRFDGWTDIGRAKSLLSTGDARNRKLIEVPTGHQLRNSREAIETFQLVAYEASEMLLGKAIAPATPDLVDLDRRGIAERERVNVAGANLRAFWHDYLLGRDESLGMQLLGGTSTYAAFMREQIQRLKLEAGVRVLDLGAGTGEFSSHLARYGDTPDGLHVVSVDFVYDALCRARERSRNSVVSESSFCCVDCEKSLPFKSNSFDRVLSSLVVCYLSDAEALVREVHRVLRPGGLFVLSCPKRDADLSTVYRHTLRELASEDLTSMVGFDPAATFDEVQREYLNEGARLVNFEEAGLFRFRDIEELRDLVDRDGFRIRGSRMSLGSPPQVAIVSAEKEM
jgi:SAM-dependent methyltransferase